MIGNRERQTARRNFLITILLVIIVFGGVWIPVVNEKILRWTRPLLLRIQHIAGTLQKRSLERQTLFDANSEIQRLQNLLTHLIVEKTEYKRLKLENVALRQIVNYQAPEKFRGQTCGIMTYDVASERKLMRIDCGSTHAITRGNAVLSPEGILIGIIDSVSEHFAVVQLLKDPRSKVAAEVAGVDDAQGIVMPVGGGAIALRFLGENVKVEAATVIQTSGLLDQVPVGLPIGTVDSTVRESDTPFQRAIIQTPIDPATLDFVNVLHSL